MLSATLPGAFAPAGHAGTAPPHDAVPADPAAWDACTRPAPGRDDWRETTVAIEGIWCAACTLAIEQAVGAVRGVESVQANGGAATARIVWTPGACAPTDWLEALRRAGYRGLPADGMADAGATRARQRVLLWRWLVAGFCMMQVMMYAAPAYLAQPGEITPDAQALLRWASWVLTLPVVLFSCRPFFAAALRDLRRARIGMDVPVALGIAIAFGASTLATLDPAGPIGGEVWFDSVTMFVFFLLSGRLLEQRLRDRTAGALQALARRLPATVERRREDGGFERVPAARLRPGDVLRVLPGEAFAADGVVLEGESRVDEALLTGESEPLPRGVGAAVIAGSHNLVAPLLVRVERAGQDTRFAGIVALMERASVDKPRLARLADRIAGPFLVGVLLAAAGAAAYWWPHGAAHAVGVAVAVLVVTCPCALSLATPAATLAAAGALARRGILVRRLDAFEDAARVDAVVFDKTGTLTHDRIAVTGGRARADADAAQALQWAGALAAQSLHPVARAVAAAAGPTPWTAEAVAETAGAGIEGTLRRGGEARRLRLGSASWCDAPPSPDGVAEVHLADATGWLAAFSLDEALRPDAAAAVAALQARQFDVALLSGDRTAAVQRVAARAGIADHRGRQSPEDKLARVRALQARGHRVAMVGDGLNDGPVLAAADVSIVMGQGAPLAQSKSDFVVPGGQVAAVPAVLALARRTRRVVRQNLAWSAAYNAVCVPMALAGWMPPWLAGLGMAASSLLVVLNAARLARRVE
jgi:Cu2+-exporting ATPase